MVNELAAKFQTENRWGDPSRVLVIEARQVLDVYLFADEYFVGFIDFARVTAAEQQQLLRWFRYGLTDGEEGAVPEGAGNPNSGVSGDSGELIQTPGRNTGARKRRISLLAFNFKGPLDEWQAAVRQSSEYSLNFYPVNSWFEDKESLRLFLLDHIKCIEKRKSPKKRDERIQRVLNMYKLLQSQGWLTLKDFVEKYPHMKVEDRQFQKDIAQLRLMEDGFLQYNHGTARYELLLK